jgi:hypothetical protein
VNHSQGPQEGPARERGPKSKKERWRVNHSQGPQEGPARERGPKDPKRPLKHHRFLRGEAAYPKGAVGEAKSKVRLSADFCVAEALWLHKLHVKSRIAELDRRSRQLSVAEFFTKNS